jgi:hypothetical protein
MMEEAKKMRLETTKRNPSPKPEPGIKEDVKTVGISR